MKLSIIIPVYNVEKYLNRCLDSILEQIDFEINDNNIEILLINDGSPDNSQEIIEDYVGKYSFIRGYEKQNGGLSDARNYGLSKSLGDYIWFIDSDDWIQNYSLSIIFDEIEKYKLDVFEFSWSEVFKTDQGYRFERDEYYESLQTGELVICGKQFLVDFGYVVCSWNKVVRKSLYSDLNFPLNTYSEDNILTLYLLNKCNRFKKKPLPLYNYFFREESITTSKSITHIKKYAEDRLAISLKINEIIQNDKLRLQSYSKLVDSNRFFVINLLYDVVKSLSIEEVQDIIDRLKEENLYPIRPYSYHNKGLKRELFRRAININIIVPYLVKVFKQKWLS